MMVKVKVVKGASGERVSPKIVTLIHFPALLAEMPC
jgi:hypothetical protein